MKLKTLVVSVLVLAVLAGIAFLLQRPAPPPSADTRMNQPLVEPAAIEAAARLRLSDQGKTVEVVRDADGTWRVATYHELPADFSKLSRLISDLGESRIRRLVTSNPERIARLEFKDTKIELFDSAGKTLTAIELGKHAETGGGRYVRFADETKAYLASLNAWIDAEAKNWANAQLLDVKPEEVAKIEIPFSEGRAVTVSRASKDAPWSADAAPTGRQVRSDRVASLLSSIGTIRFSDTTAPDDPAVATALQHPREFKFTTFDGKTISTTLGRKPEEKKLKPPTASADGKSGPAALGSLSDLAGKDGAAAEQKSAAAEGEPAPAGPKPLEPEYETIPAGPVFVKIAHSDSSAPVNALMQKRAFQVSDYVFTGLPQKTEELFEPAPAAAPAPAETEAEPAADAESKTSEPKQD